MATSIHIDWKKIKGQEKSSLHLQISIILIT